MAGAVECGSCYPRPSCFQFCSGQYIQRFCRFAVFGPNANRISSPFVFRMEGTFALLSSDLTLSRISRTSAKVLLFVGLISRVGQLVLLHLPTFVFSTPPFVSALILGPFALLFSALLHDPREVPFRYALLFSFLSQFALQWAICDLFGA